jgi:hypothetical protein
MYRALASLLVLLALPAAAHAGGWATVGLSSTPAGTAPGDTWVVDLEILQHGRTPLNDVAPAVIVRRGDGAEQRFEAMATGEPGMYRAEVGFPAAGEYTYVVDDGFVGPVHTYPPVTIGAGDTAAATSGDPGGAGALPWIALGAFAAISVAVLLLPRRRLQLPA